MIDASLIDDFIPEAFDQLEILENNIILLEKRDQSEEVISSLFRAAHTIKGSSEYIGLSRIATVAHKLENLLDMVRRKEILPDDELISLLINLHDCMAGLANDLLKYKQEKTVIDQVVAETDAFCARVKQKAGDADAAGGPGGEAARGDGDEEYLDFGDDLEERANDDADADAVDELALEDRGVEDRGVEDQSLEDEDLLDFESSLSDQLDEMADEQAEPAGGTTPSPKDAEDRMALGRLAEQVAYEEEYDEELFKIFLDHLQENLDGLLEVLSKGNEKKPKEILLQCLNIITSLRSSAAYMDYAELVTFYDAWSAQIAAISRKADSEAPVSFAFITDYMDQMIRHFSLSEKFSTATIASDIQDAAPIDRTEADAGDFPSEPEDIPKDEELPPEMPDTPTGQEVMEVPDEFADDAPVESDEMEIVGDADEDSSDTREPSETAGLFDELDMVFDSFGQRKKPETVHIDPFADDIEDELSALPSSGPAPKTSKAPDKGPLKEPVASKPSIAIEPTEKKPVQQKPVEKPAGRPVEPSASKPVQPEETTTALKPEKAVASPPATPGEKTPPKRTEPVQQKPTEKPVPPKTETDTAEAGTSPIIDDDATGKVIYDDHTGTRVSRQTLRVAADKIDKLMNQVGELVVNRASYAQLYNEMREFQRQIRNMGLDAKESKWIRDFTFRLSEATVAMGRVANDLQEGVMKIRMLPISQLFNRYPRLVRDLVHNTGKQVTLDIHGEETELDKMVIEEIADPLVHIIRNAVDHGIETTAERKLKGKPATATVRLESFHESNHVVIEITDDGKGIDTQAIRNVAVAKGLFSREEVDKMRPKEVMGIIMMPGFSTSETVTTTSGRGVGMDVVKKNVEKLNGTIEIDSEHNEGTRIRIKIPLTLAIIQALLVRIGGEVFTIPLSVIEETLRVPVHEINSIEGIEVIQLREGVLSLLRLTDEFKKKSQSKEPEHEFVVVVNTGMRQVGLVVDSLIGQEEAVIKPLVDFLQERSGFSGATILGDGSVSLILDVYELVNICMERQTALKHTGEGLMDFSGNRAAKTAKNTQRSTLH